MSVIGGKADSFENWRLGLPMTRIGHWKHHVCAGIKKHSVRSITF